MLQISIDLSATLPLISFGKKKDAVDKGTTRKTPNDSGDAKPPKKEDFKKIERENDKKNDAQEETVDNEERDKNKE
ncbi:hypothetical protein J2X69_004594 [Algoriphagus sp. 4150]|uniref:hypothetical protein n=1 Tax=Algoriphagus sp. 4150 TaxID=2817756 RepID=UPI00285EA001|nr:hypothetical protein [Algoriphagus sp. 4150]MDR7132227.1 hypothetical protein [Algoriphagus sp. 4150]